MTIIGFDHAAIPISNVEKMLSFYAALGFEVRAAHPPLFYSVHFGDQKINFHGPDVWRSKTFTLRGAAAEPGCGDFCFVWDGPLENLLNHLQDAGIELEEGPVDRLGGRNTGRDEGTSVYVRDPDANLLELIVYDRNR